MARSIPHREVNTVDFVIAAILSVSGESDGQAGKLGRGARERQSGQGWLRPPPPCVTLGWEQSPSSTLDGPLIRIVLVDDHVMILEGLRALLDAQPGMEIVGICATGEEALALVGATRAELVVLDYFLPGMNGIETLAALRSDGFVGGAILLTGTLKEGVLQAGLALGLGGIVLKEGGSTHLVHAIEAVASGDRYFSPEATEHLLHLQEVPSHSAPDPLSPLTPRERSVVLGVVEGRTNRGIASDLGISEGTVKIHLHSVFRKLGVSNRVQLGLLAQETLRKATPPPPRPPTDPESTRGRETPRS